MILVYRYRVKSPTKILDEQSRAVNYVWNFCNESQKSCLRLGKRWLSGFDLDYLTTGTSKELGLHSGTINSVCDQYAKSRKQKKRPFLRWRGKKSLGWIPFKGRNLKWKGDAFVFGGNTFRVFFSRPIPDGAIIRDGSNFSQDARGNWFLNVVLRLPDNPRRGIRTSVGIDLGLHDLAALSTGEKIENPRHLAKLADKLARAQRAGKKKQATNIHAHVKNARRDFQHKLSTCLVKQFDAIYVGNVSSSKLSKTRLAKSVLDAGWSSFRSMLAYKCDYAGGRFSEVNESFSTQVCSSCGCLPEGRPKGIADLGKRQWDCVECGSHLDRDLNSALNILHAGSGHRSPAEGIPAL